MTLYRADREELARLLELHPEVAAWQPTSLQTIARTLSNQAQDYRRIAELKRKADPDAAQPKEFTGDMAGDQT